MGVLNFDTDKLITGVNIIDNNLYWTDNLNEPKKLEIDRFRDYNHSGSGTTIRGELALESDLTVIRLHPWKPIELDLVEYPDPVPVNQPEPPFENIFPRFSYRWRYEDGQYSPYAPFTQAAFIPKERALTSMGTRGEDDFVPDTEEANYIEGFNTTLYNNVGQINLNNIPRGPRDVVAIDLLYTESISSTIYTLETLEIPQDQRGLDYVLSSSYTGGAPRVPQDYSLLPLSYSLSARKIYRALPANQLTRPYDEVPQKALAQEITANRLIYGNYQTGFNQPDALEIDTEFVSAGAGDGLHVKGNRSYEIGVAYIDAYGRQGSMLQAGSIIQDDGSPEVQVPLTSDFNQSTREQIQAKITSPPPPWADRYRYFIKDPSMDHHNLISYNIYNDGTDADVNSEFIWIEFQSTDRNKVFDETSAGDGNTATILVLRRNNETVVTEKQRFLVQDIENEAPADVREQLTATISNTELSRQGSTASSNTNQNGINPDIVVGSTQVVLDANGNTAATRQVFQDFIVEPLNAFIRAFQPEVVADQQPEISVVSSGSPVGDVADLTQLTSQMFVRLTLPGNNNFVGDENTYLEVLEIANRDDIDVQISGRQVRLTFGRRFEFSEEDGLQEVGTGLPAVATVFGLEIFTTRASDAAVERLGGRFWVRAARNGLETTQSQFTFEGELVNLNQLWFETEPAVAESQLDLFWEASDTFCVCTDHGWDNKINWTNCVAEVDDTGGVYLESTRINDRFNTVQLVKGVRVNVPTDRNEEIERNYGLTWSGIYNSRTGINRLNQFIFADGITKELEPNYGSLQKLHTRDTNLIALCEDKVFRIQADKDALFNADGSSNVTASNNVLGQTIPVIGEFGISTNPESFASYGHNIWFSDAKRGAVMQYTPNNGQLFEISRRGMNDFFRDRLFSADKIVGMYDDYGDAYVISIQGYDHTDDIISPDDLLPSEDGNITVKYETSVEGWPSFLSFIPESGLTLNNKFFTFKEGQAWMHNSNTEVRNNFYGDQYNSDIQVVFNDNPSAVKEFLTLSYEGTPDWEVVGIDTESEDPSLTSTWPFVRKENKYFTPIVSQEDVYVIDPAGTITADDGTTMLSVSGTRDKSGIKGFFNNVTLQNTSEDKAELFSINTEAFVSSN